MTIKATQRNPQRPAAAPSRLVAPRQTAADVGVPRFLQPSHDAQAEAHAQAAAQAFGHAPPLASSPALQVSAAARQQARDVVQRAGPGRPADAATQAAARLHGIQGDSLRIHDDAHAHWLTSHLGANAVTAGSHLLFAPGRYAPHSPSGQALLNHEMAHVAQQRAQPQALQCDLNRSFHLPHGSFHVHMKATSSDGRSRESQHLAQLRGKIKFEPDPLGPYSNDIGLIQAVRNLDRSDGDSSPGRLVDWASVRDGNSQRVGTEAERNILQTAGPESGQGQAVAGWGIDLLPSLHQRGEAHLPDYGGDNRHGWARGLDDVRSAWLQDGPGANRDADFFMETVARADDTLQVYGSLQWGFRVRDGEIEGEYASASEQATAAFGEALERFRGYYVHEPFVVYFAQGSLLPDVGQEAQLESLPDYLRRYPDVSLQLLGVASEAESPDWPVELAAGRAQTVRDLLRGRGMPAHTRVSAHTRVGANRVDGAVLLQRRSGPPGHLARVGSAASGPVVAPTERKVDVSFEHSLSGVPIRMPWRMLPGPARL